MGRNVLTLHINQNGDFIAGESIQVKIIGTSWVDQYGSIWTFQNNRKLYICYESRDINLSVFAVLGGGGSDIIQKTIECSFGVTDSMLAFYPKEKGHDQYGGGVKKVSLSSDGTTLILSGGSIGYLLFRKDE